MMNGYALSLNDENSNAEILSIGTGMSLDVLKRNLELKLNNKHSLEKSPKLYLKLVTPSGLNITSHAVDKYVAFDDIIKLMDSVTIK